MAADVSFDDAVKFHRQGRIQEAEQVYRRILDAEPNHAGALHLLGVVRQQQGDHQTALELIGRAISLSGPQRPSRPAPLPQAGEPSGSAAQHNNYGTALQSLGRFEEALASFRRALAIRPQYPQALANAGLALASLGRHHEAVGSFRKGLELDPENAHARIELATLLENRGRQDEAIRLYEEGIRHAPCLEYYVNLGPLLVATDRADLAVGALQEAIRLAPDCAAARVNLGLAHAALGHDEAAVDEYRKAIELSPELADAHFGLGEALKDQGKIEEAAAHYRRAVELKPDSPTMHGNLLLCEQYRAGARPAGLAAAHAEWDRRHAAPLRAAWRPFSNGRDPQRALRLGFVSGNFRQHPVGLFTIRAIEALKNLPSPPAPLPSCRVQQAGEGSESPSPPAAEGNPKSQIRNSKQISNLKFEIQNSGPHPAPLPEGEGSRDCEVVCYSDVARRIDFQSVLATRYTDCQPGPNSTDYKSIPHQTDCQSILHQTDYKSIPRKTDWQSAPRPRPDAITERFMAAADRWVDTAELSDEQLAEQIRNDGIDILFDLGGHLGGNRLLVFARKPAPIQVKWVGYPGSAGLTAMDYLLADRWQVEAGGKAYCPEKVLRLPDGYVCFDPPGHAPEVGALPALQSSLTPCPSPAGGRGETKALTPASLTPGPSPIPPSTAGGRGETKALTPASLTPGPSPEYGRGELVVTFGSFNNPAKITPCVVAAWAEILRRVPGSRLLLKYGGFAQEGTRRWYEGLFASGGVGPERLELLGWSPRGRMLAEYNRVDLALDPFPYSGGITTCEALWMGVPVITLPGKTFAGRHSLSHLSNVGLTETVARDVVDYVELAVRLAHDLPRLAKWRAELRGQVARSPLCDGPRFAANLMTALRSIWQEWVAKGPIVP